MIELSQLTLLIMAEVTIGLAVLSGVLGYLALSRKQRIRKAAQHLAERVQSDEPARTERLKTLLSEKYDYSEADREQILHNITQAEMLLFQNLINGYMKGDVVHLQQIDVDEENLVLAYQALEPAEKAAPPAVDDEAGETELVRLQDENQRLSEELRVTMDTMGRMLNEYSSMFAGGSDKPLTREPAAAPVSEAPDEAEPADPLDDAEDVDVEIPELQASDVAVESVAQDPDDALDAGSESVSTLDEEVSEIIDEVMEIADEMNQDGEDNPEAEKQAGDLAESLLDELDQVDIDLPETTPSGNGDEAEPEAGSLEDEWAKLLEEDARNKTQSDNE